MNRYSGTMPKPRHSSINTPDQGEQAAVSRTPCALSKKPEGWLTRVPHAGAVSMAAKDVRIQCKKDALLLRANTA